MTAEQNDGLTSQIALADLAELEATLVALSVGSFVDKEQKDLIESACSIASLLRITLISLRGGEIMEAWSVNNRAKEDASSSTCLAAAE